jgi:hypothetical protein
MIMGDLRMPLEQGMKLTLNELIIMQLGKNREHERVMHNTRLIMWEIRTKYLAKGKSITPADIFKLSNDPQTKPERMTKEKFLELIERTNKKN